MVGAAIDGTHVQVPCGPNSQEDLNLQASRRRVRRSRHGPRFRADFRHTGLTAHGLTAQQRCQRPRYIPSSNQRVRSGERDGDGASRPARGATRPALREGGVGCGGSNGSPLVAMALSRWPRGGATGPAGDSRCVAGGGAGSALIGRRGRAWTARGGRRASPWSARAAGSRRPGWHPPRRRPPRGPPAPAVDVQARDSCSPAHRGAAVSEPAAVARLRQQ
jgi:hypothetical protein